MDEKNFISRWIKTLNDESIKNFSTDFFAACNCFNYNLPGKALLIGKEFFGEYELISAEGLEVFRVDSYERAKFFIYANRSKPKILSVPIENSFIKDMTTKYERYLDSIIKRIKQDYRSYFLTSKNFTEVINQIYNHLNLVRLK